MARIDMNFVSRQSLPWRTLFFLAVGLAGSLHAVWLRDDLLSQRAARQDEIRQLERLQSHSRVSEASRDRQNPAVVAETKRLIMELQRPWEGMLDSLQKVARPDMQIIRLQPESNANRLLISGQADNSQAFLSYVSRLREDVAWHSVAPISEEKSAAAFTQGSKPVSFQLMAEWRQE